MNKYLIIRDDSQGRYTTVGTFESMQTDNKLIHIELYAYMKYLYQNNVDSFYNYFLTTTKKEVIKWCKNWDKTFKESSKINKNSTDYEDNGVMKNRTIIDIHGFYFELQPLSQYKSINEIIKQKEIK